MALCSMYVVDCLVYIIQ